MRKKPTLPTELVEDILLRLPVKPLQRFRCVSEQWLSLIDTPDFIKLHLNRSIETRNNRSLLIRSNDTYLIDLDSTDVSIKVDHPVNNSHGNNPVVKGSCNGVVLLKYYSCSHDYLDILIWNPFTRNYHELPFSGFNFINSEDRIIYGIGYDSVHDDYKVVKMIQFGREDDDTAKGTEVYVYSLKSNTWRRIRDFPYYICSECCYCDGVYSGGALNWAVYENYDTWDIGYIGAFDLSTEEYGLVKMPNNDDKQVCNYEVKVAGLEGNLCIFWINWKEKCTDIWVMKSYGIRESWTKLISVGQHELPEYVHNIMPLCFSKDGRVLLMHEGNNLIWIDLKSKVETVVDGLPSNFSVEFVTQSLVPIRAGSGIYV